MPPHEMRIDSRPDEPDWRGTLRLFVRDWTPLDSLALAAALAFVGLLFWALVEFYRWVGS